MRNGERLFLAFERDLRKAARLDLATLFDLVHAIAELAVARLRLSTQKAHELLGSSDMPPTSGPPALVARSDLHPLIGRVLFAIPRMGARVPWRADCLVQALAAQRWLRRRGVATSLVVGVRKPAPMDFEAHAWLMAGDQIVTGGPVSSYDPIFKQPTC